MSTPSSLRVRDGANFLTVRRGDVLGRVFTVVVNENQNTVVLNPEGIPRFYLVHFRVDVASYTFRISEANAVNAPIGPNPILLANTAPIVRTGDIGTWLSYSPVLNNLTGSRRVSFKIYTERRITIIGNANYAQYGALEYPMVMNRSRPDLSGNALIRLGSIFTGRLSEVVNNPAAPFTRGGAGQGRLVPILTRLAAASGLLTVVIVPPPTTGNQFYSLGEINLVNAGSTITFPAGNYEVTILYIDDGIEAAAIPGLPPSSPATALFIPILATPAIREMLRLGDRNPLVNSILVQSTLVNTRRIWIRRGFPVFS